MKSIMNDFKSVLAQSGEGGISILGRNLVYHINKDPEIISWLEKPGERRYKFK